MKRYDIINQFITARGYTSFLEIGTEKGESFRHVNCDVKVSVDPDPATNATYVMTSDAFFATHDGVFDIVFIDGLHEHNQAFRDVLNALHSLSPNGVIVMHDCHPTNRSMEQADNMSKYNMPWTGDVWKAFVKARAEYPYLAYVVDVDYGCGIIDTAHARSDDVSDLPTDMETMTYHQFVMHPEWMNFQGGVMNL